MDNNESVNTICPHCGTRQQTHKSRIKDQITIMCCYDKCKKGFTPKNNDTVIS